MGNFGNREVPIMSCNSVPVRFIDKDGLVTDEYIKPASLVFRLQSSRSRIRITKGNRTIIGVVVENNVNSILVKRDGEERIERVYPWEVDAIDLLPPEEDD